MHYQRFSNYFFSIIILSFLFLFFSGLTIRAQNPLEKNWHVTLQTRRFGPVETILQFEEHEDGRLFIHSLSGSHRSIKKLAGVKKQRAQIDEYLFALTLEKSQGETFQGKMLAPWPDGGVWLEMTGKGFTGKISGGSFQGDFSGVPLTNETKPLRDYKEVVDSLLKTVGTKIFAPKELQRKEWNKLTGDLKEIGKTARDDLDILLGFQFAYEGKPFSHLTFGRARVPAHRLMIQFDSFRVGNDPVRLAFEDKTAILTVRTMIGVDTIELLEKAFREIAEKSPESLIIDLRGNGGGAFAIKPLIEHIIDEPLDAGYFITHQWNLKNERLPTREELFKVKPWEGFSLKAWWGNVQAEEIIRLKFEPKEPNFNGSVFVLMDSDSASATEMAIDALSTVKDTKLIGEKTSGQVLSQSPFDTSQGFQAFIPVADYYSFHHGRIEGVGIKPDIEVKSEDALETAKKLAGGK